MKQGATPWSLQETETPDFLEAGICTYVQRSPMWHLTERLSFSSLNTVRKSPAPRTNAHEPASGIKLYRTSVQFFSDGRFLTLSASQTPSLTGREGPRKPPRPGSSRNIAKSGTRGFWRRFRPENRKHRTSLPKSTDVWHGKYGCLCSKVPMFLRQNRPILHDFYAAFGAFCRKIQ